jgi:selenide,water dikinase
MLQASAVGAELETEAVPALPGARALLNAGWRSSFHDSNRRAHATDVEFDPLWLDPQTSGGLLAAVPRAQLAALQAACAAAAEELYVIGKITDGPPVIRAV